MLQALLIFAADEAPKQGADNPLGMILLFAPFILLLYLVIVILPGNRRREKERQALVNQMKKNDEVLTVAGIYGTVVSVSETKDEVVVKVDDGTRLRMTKGSILRNLTREEEAVKAQKDSKEQK
jgi:preprotein translocase subunit YajC